MEPLIQQLRCSQWLETARPKRSKIRCQQDGFTWSDSGMNNCQEFYSKKFSHSVIQQWFFIDFHLRSAWNGCQMISNQNLPAHFRAHSNCRRRVFSMDTAGPLQGISQMVDMWSLFDLAEMTWANGLLLLWQLFMVGSILIPVDGEHGCRSPIPAPSLLSPRSRPFAEYHHVPRHFGSRYHPAFPQENWPLANWF